MSGSQRSIYLQFGNTKIREDGFPHWIARRVAFIEQDVSRFDIAMDHALPVSVVNGQANRGKELNDLHGGRELSLA